MKANEEKLSSIVTLIAIMSVMALLLCCELSHSQVQQMDGKISLEITSDRNEFVKYEHIELELTITNLTNSELSVPDPTFFYNLGLNLIDENGQRVPNYMMIHYYRDEGLKEMVLLPARSVRVEAFDMRGFFNDDPSSNKIIGATAVVPGLYRVQATLAGVKSNLFEFRVKGHSALDREVLERIHQEVMAPEREVGIEGAKSLLKEYPNHPFMTDVYRWLRTYCRNSKNPSAYADLLMSSSLDLIERRPKSPEVLDALETYGEGLRLKMGASLKEKVTMAEANTIADSLNGLKKKYTSERIHRYIDKIITRFRNIE